MKNCKDDRRLYDLCRKYKYFYKKLRILKDADEKVYDKYLKKAISSTEGELRIIEYDLSNYMLDKAIQPLEYTMNTHIGGWGISKLEMTGIFNSSFMEWMHHNSAKIGSKFYRVRHG